MFLLTLLLLGCPKGRVYPDGRGLEGQLEREIIALTERVHMLEAENKKCMAGGGEAPMYADLKQIIVAKDVTVAMVGANTVITMPDTHVFGADGKSIREEAYVTLDLLGAALSGHPELTVVVEGHTADLVPPPLSKQFSDPYDAGYFKARTVSQALTGRFHVPESMITVSSRGPNKPIASNDTSAGQTQNARVVVVIYPPGIR